MQLQKAELLPQPLQHRRHVLQQSENTTVTMADASGEMLAGDSSLLCLIVVPTADSQVHVAFLQ